MKWVIKGEDMAGGATICATHGYNTKLTDDEIRWLMDNEDETFKYTRFDYTNVVNYQKMTPIVKLVKNSHVIVSRISMPKNLATEFILRFDI